ncbi:MAG: response regulator [Desulfosalsimonadaceae bacterium]
MDKVLIVDSDRKQLAAIRNEFKGLRQFEPLTAINGKGALETLQQVRVSVVVANMMLPDMDSVDLVAHLTRISASTPCIIMTETDKSPPVFPAHSRKDAMLSYIEKPIALRAMGAMIFAGLNIRDEGMSLRGIVLAHLLPLVALCRKSCQMDIVSERRKEGVLYFQDGVLLDARSNGQAGDDVALEMSNWGRIVLTLSPLPEKKIRPRIKTDLIDLAGARWKRGAPTTGSPEKKASPVSPYAVGAGPSPAAPPPVSEGSRLEVALRRYATSFQAIKGYRGVAILGSDGSILATDTGPEPITFSNFAAEFDSIVSYCSKIASQKGFSRCTSVTLHTENGIVIMTRPDLYRQGNFRFIGVLAPDANGYFMQVQLEKTIPQILAAM